MYSSTKKPLHTEQNETWEFTTSAITRKQVLTEKSMRDCRPQAQRESMWRRAQLGMILASLATAVGSDTMVEMHKDIFDDSIEANSEVLVHFLAPCAFVQYCSPPALRPAARPTCQQ